MTAPTKTIPGVLRRYDPLARKLRLLFDSPHSGTAYPADFRHDCARDAIRWGEDSFIDDLYGVAPAHGGCLLVADFPRTYIDPNRALEDMDPGMVEGDWPHQVIENAKAAEGIGLIWQNGGAGGSIYELKLSVAEVEKRIETCWKPYHKELDALAADMLAHWKKRWHINCHSMYSAPFAEHLGKAEVPGTDIVLGNRDGETCDDTFVDVVATAFRDEGLSVAVNKRFKGVEIVRKLGNPGRDCHSLQIEIDRALYMDEWKMERGPGYADLKRTVSRVVAQIAEFVRAQV